MKEQVGSIYRRNDSSDDEKEESNTPDGCSGAEVMEDDDYTMRD